MEVLQVDTARVKGTWAYAVSHQVLDGANLSELNLKFNKKLGRDETFQDKYPLLFESLQNAFARHLLLAKRNEQ